MIKGEIQHARFKSTAYSVLRGKGKDGYFKFAGERLTYKFTGDEIFAVRLVDQGGWSELLCFHGDDLLYFYGGHNLDFLSPLEEIALADDDREIIGS